MAHHVTPHLMFGGDAEEAMHFYISLFPGSEILDIEKYRAGEEGEEGTLKRAIFSVGGQAFICIDSPVEHDFTFTPSMSIFVDCEDESELKAAYDGLSEGGEILMPMGDYGFSKQFVWLNDRFGVSWQLNLK